VSEIFFIVTMEFLCADTCTPSVPIFIFVYNGLITLCEDFILYLLRKARGLLHAHVSSSMLIISLYDF
jgi:hypothetical protein